MNIITNIIRSLLLITFSFLPTLHAGVNPLGINLGETTMFETLDRLSWNEVINKDDLDWNVYALQSFLYAKLPFKKVKFVHVTADDQGVIQKLQISMEEDLLIRNYTTIFKSLQEKYILINKTNAILGDKKSSFQTEGYIIDLESIVRIGDLKMHDLGDITVNLTYRSPQYIEAKNNLQSKWQAEINRKECLRASEEAEKKYKQQQLPKTLQDAL